MSMIKNNKAEISKYIGLNGQKNVRLVISCSKCIRSNSNVLNNKTCISCFHKNVYFNLHEKISEVSIGTNNMIISSQKIQQFVDYYDKLQKLYNYFQKIENNRIKKCSYKNFKCKVFPTAKILKKNDFLDPIFFLLHIEKRIATIQDSNIHDLNCKACTIQVQKSLHALLKTINGLSIIKNAKSYKHDNKKLHDFYEDFLTTNLNLKSPEKKEFDKKKQKIKIIDKYALLIYNIKILRNKEDPEKRYQIELFYNSKAEENFIQKIVEDILNNMDKIQIQNIVKFVDLIDIYKKKAVSYINHRYKNITPERSENIALLASLIKLKFEKIFPILIDDFIEELFLDSPNDEIYVNHQKYGRCLTGIRLSPVEIERMKTFLRIYSGKRLDYSSPTLKYVLKNKYFHCRFAIDLDPIHFNDFGFDIRKLNKNILTIQDLLKNKTLNPNMAAFLYFSILKRQNITVTGETDTGKTTLINALDLLTPKEFRKIYVESAVESLNQLEYGKHQLKYVVDDLQNSDDMRLYSKSNQIKTLLHRSPDIIYLGEILTKREGEAMFHCLAAGLKGFQTIHSRSVQSLMNRIKYFFNIDPSCISDLDLIVLMKKQKNRRKILSISETKKGNREKDHLHLIYQYNPEFQDWRQLVKHSDLDLIKNLRQYEDLKEENLNNFLNIFEEIFGYLFVANKFPVDKLVDFFHKISYFSYVSYLDLKKFWDDVKDNLG